MRRASPWARLVVLGWSLAHLDAPFPNTEDARLLAGAEEDAMTASPIRTSTLPASRAA